MVTAELQWNKPWGNTEYYNETTLMILNLSILALVINASTRLEDQTI